ncbi:MAG: LytTR family DNA-binding domain-containing protein [Bacteroidota bacterium]
MFQKTIKAVIVDDESLARDMIKHYLSDHSEIEIVEECENGYDGLKAIQEHKPDLLFLDIMMPKINGFELLELVDDPPVVIFSTAYDEYAIKAFELQAADYLLKPYDQERFEQALKSARQKLKDEYGPKNEIRKILESRYAQQETIRRIVVKINTKVHVISVHDIIYIEAMDDYVRIHTSKNSFLKQNTMKYFEAHLPKDDFIRVHRSYICSVSQIDRIESLTKDSFTALLKNGENIPVSRSGYAKLKEQL